MTRACRDCEWWLRGSEVVAGPFASDPIEVPSSQGDCTEGPVRVRTAPDHWCSRFKLAERLAGGIDVRKRA